MVSNALKYTHVGKIAIDFRFNKSASWLEIEVMDTGVGIRNENLRDIFKPFTQLHDQEINQGVGLGLCISKMIVKELNGKISIRSKVDEGSTFVASMEASIFEV